MSAIWSSLLDNYPLAATSGGTVLHNLVAEAAASTVACPLGSLGLLTLSGPDASTFLQGQMTCDMREVTAQQSRLGCYVSLKGRAITSFRVMQKGENIHLIMDAGLVVPVRDRLAKYIVFSKASLRLSHDHALLGLAGTAAADVLDQLLDEVPQQANAVVHAAGLSAVRLHGEQRFLLLLDADTLPGRWQQLQQLTSAAGENAWLLHQIAAGEGSISLASTELFQPQELNFQLLDGISYSKGCYTGQEIVARLHFRGKLKQHLQGFTVTASAAPTPGTALFAEGKHAGDVVLAARRDADQLELLAIARPEQAGLLHLGGSEGPVLHARPLPYLVPATA